MRVFGRFLCPAHLPAHPAHLWRSAAAAHGGVRQCSRSAARTRKSPVFARLSPFSNARPSVRTPSVKRERPEALETRRRRKKTPEQRRAAVVIDTERARRRRGVGSKFSAVFRTCRPCNPLISLPFSAYPTFSRPVSRSPSFLTLISLRHIQHNRRPNQLQMCRFISVCRVCNFLQRPQSHHERRRAKPHRRSRRKR